MAAEEILSSPESDFCSKDLAPAALDGGFEAAFLFCRVKCPSFLARARTALLSCLEPLLWNSSMKVRGCRVIVARMDSGLIPVPPLGLLIPISGCGHDTICPSCLPERGLFTAAGAELQSLESTRWSLHNLGIELPDIAPDLPVVVSKESAWNKTGSTPRRRLRGSGGQIEFFLFCFNWSVRKWRSETRDPPCKVNIGIRLLAPLFFPYLAIQ